MDALHGCPPPFFRSSSGFLSIFVILFAAILLLVFLLPAASSAQEWTHGGPKGFGFSGVFVSPYPPHTIYVLSGREHWRNGTWKSDDSGVTWDSLGGDYVTMRQILFHPAGPDTLWMLNAENIRRSTDGGQTWSPSNAGIPPDATVNKLILDPHHPDHLFALADSPSPGLFRSFDGGGTWTLSPDSVTGPWDPNEYFVADLVFDPFDEDHIIAAFSAYEDYTVFYESPDQGLTWQAVPTQEEYFFGVEALVADATTPGRLVAWIHGNFGDFDLTAFDDFGGSYGEVGHTVYWSFGLQVDPFGRVYSSDSVPRLLFSHDYGLSWETFTADLRLRDERFNSPWVVEPYFAFVPGDSQSVYVATARGLFHTTDNGATWEELAGGDHLIIQYHVVPHPSRANEVHLVTYGGHWRSDDAGETWTSAGQLDVENLVFSPNDPNLFYRLGEEIARSTDGGATWESIRGNLLYNGSAIAEHPDNPDVLIVGEFGPLYGMFVGVSRSTDGGASWSPVAVPLTSNYSPVQAIRIDPVNPDQVLVLQHGLFGSLDGGDTWESLLDGDPFLHSVYRRADGSYIVGGSSGVYLSPDGWGDWEVITDPGLDNIKDVALNPADPAALWLVTPDSVYFTRDEGENWTTLDGPYPPDLVSIGFSADGLWLYLATREHGVWRRDMSDGVADPGAGPALPLGFTLLPAYPNPFNAGVFLPLVTGRAREVQLDVYNLRGRLVRTLLHGTLPPGVHEVYWDGRCDAGFPAGSGIYFLRASGGDAAMRRKVVLVR